MKDATHHLMHIQRKVIRESKNNGESKVGPGLGLNKRPKTVDTRVAKSQNYR